MEQQNVLYGIFFTNILSWLVSYNIAPNKPTLGIFLMFASYTQLGLVYETRHLVTSHTNGHMILYHKGEHDVHTKIKTWKTIYIIIQKRNYAIVSKQWYIIQRNRGRVRYSIEEYPVGPMQLCVFVYVEQRINRERKSML